jgi:hypothetical protein
MKKLFAVLALALIAFAPVIASADSVGYLQGQQNQVVVGASQAQLYIGFAGQTQAGGQQSLQQQVSVNHADSLTAVVVFGFPVLVVGQSVNANGANTQGQASGYFQTQGGAGLALGVQRQGIVQSQGQFQLSTGSGSN